MRGLKSNSDFANALSTIMNIRKKHQTPTISVLLPVYNAERYISLALESIITQTFDDFELLALDDGSTDRSLSILREYETKDDRLRIYSRENRGLVKTLNELINLSRGAYLARMDADDISRPQRFEKQIAYLEAHPECVAVGTRSLVIDTEGMPIREFITNFTHDEIDSAHLSGIGQSEISHPSVMMRREAVERAGRYREDYRCAEEMDLFLRLAEIGKLANLPEVLILYRQHLQSFCYAQGNQLRIFGRRATQEARLRRGLPAVPETSVADSKFETPPDVHRKWAWWALSAGHIRTARKHALKALALDPLCLANLKVVACAIRGH
jgi:glycosyltransferase involved in cell wall biosynthesis